MESDTIRAFSDVIKGKRILVTGGTGSFGHIIVRELLKLEPSKIVVLSRDEDKQFRMEMEFKNKKLGYAPGDMFQVSDDEQFKIRDMWEEDKLNFSLGDVRDLDRLMEVTKGIDIIYHAAALKHVPLSEYHPYEAVKTNIGGARNIKTAAIENGVERVVAISTDKAVKPVNAMGMSKALQEKVFLSEEEIEYDTKFACVRFGNVIGSRGSVIPVFANRIKSNEPLLITHPEMTRFLLTLDDAVRLVFYATSEMMCGEIFVKKSPSCNIIDLANVMSENLAKGKGYPIKIVGLRPGEKLHETLVSKEEMFTAKEKGEYFVIPPFDNREDSTKQDSGIFEYSSNTAEKLDKKRVYELLKNTGWI